MFSEQKNKIKVSSITTQIKEKIIMKTIEELQEEIKALKEKNKDLRATNKQQKEEISELKKQLKSPIKNIILGGETIDASSIGPLDKELKTAIKSLHFGQQELRFVVDRYYDIQSKRIELSNQIVDH